MSKRQNKRKTSQQIRNRKNGCRDFQSTETKSPKDRVAKVKMFEKI